MASIFSLYIPIFMAYTASILPFSLASYPNYSPTLISSISAAPEFSPFPSPSPSPASDISPLFPTPGGATLPPSSLPTIPSSPSPPNPDFMDAAPAPEMSLPPSQSLPFSAAVSLNFDGWCWPVLVALTTALAVELCR
ncbi:classical arabinogalactan protein 26-like [Benincasa hispida]|uniref:classical arabinogalactan protein 26-like n=1 Tax=Benincasa hispida TaxID=102211 RepID=UPI001901A1B6|nr:classical arabinogalactan protein 26-like [Benincasa hispida]